jgi:superfamily II DNA or RNA helicase
MVRLSELRLRAVRARIAEVASVVDAPERLGTVRLRAHQRLAVSRVTAALRQHGGCLLADDVGRGKTFVALAVANTWARPLLVVPASLRRTWQQAMERAALSCALVTHEALSRGSSPRGDSDGIIVDESHRFRSPDTRRHESLARIAAHARVLLLSATPLQNGSRDLAAQLALFLGSAAYRASDAELARHVIREAACEDDPLPAVAAPRWLRPAHDDGAVLREILALPPPARAMDAGDAGVLRTIGLVRAWASSRAALASAIRHRRRIAIALEQCAADGLAPRQKDLRAWQAVGQDVQLALAPLLVSRADDPAMHDDMLRAIAAERDALDRLAGVLMHSNDPDLARAATLRALRAEHPGERVLAFSEFATTVRAYHSLLRADAGVGMLTATDARISSGRVSRDALLDRFAPRAQGAAPPAQREQVTLLIATDLLSEGVNLQDASVVVHLDLPWNPARLAQRLGRVRRPGGSPIVHNVLMASPAQSELLLRVERRLRGKLEHAERAIGRSLPVLPALTADACAPSASALTRDHSSAEVLGAIARHLAAWGCARTGRETRCSGASVVAAVASAERGWLAALDDGRLLARCGNSTSDAGLLVAHALDQTAGMPRACADFERAQALGEAQEWLAQERIARDCGLRVRSSPLYDALERRLSASIRRTPRHQRPIVLTHAARLRESLLRVPSLGMERELLRLLNLHAQGAIAAIDWLERSISTVTRRAPVAPLSRASRVLAAIVFGDAATA